MATMKIREARQAYTAQLEVLRDRQRKRHQIKIQFR